MAAVITNEYGKVTMNEELIANIAGFAALENYGLVGMKNQTTSQALIELVRKDNLKRGVKITTLGQGEELDVDLYVTLEYGVSMPAVAQNIMQNVRYRVNEMTGLNVRNVHVHVEAVRVNQG